MKSDVQNTDGSAGRSAPDQSLAPFTALTVFFGIVCLIAFDSVVAAQALYKYRGEDGEWIYADRPPVDGAVDEIRSLTPRLASSGVAVRHEIVGRSLRFSVRNDYYAPVEFILDFEAIRGLERPHPEARLHWVLPPQSDTSLLELGMLADGTAPHAEYRYSYAAGDPAAEHRPEEPYRVPFAVAADFPITQAYPHVTTHNTPDSKYAIDFAMPIGTDIFAARAGVVFDVVNGHYGGGTDLQRDLPRANVVRILHDDGTFAIYGHLSWRSIRVRRGQRVQRGEFIAESGNTGFSTGPHLHFAVVRNTGMAVESVPVQFLDVDFSAVNPAMGSVLTAY